jgi:uncharacterized 2Fe-2S/4Fe-4S cluster protein (DUF4445 family)
MNDTISVRLSPADVSFEAERGRPLRGPLALHGVDLPCGGAAACGGCRIRVLAGTLTPTVVDRQSLTARELAEGWRLACKARAESDVVLEVQHRTIPVLADDRPIPAGRRRGLGIAVDVGSTTIAAQLIDLANGAVLGVRTALNPQVAEGADVMSRVRFALNSRALTERIRTFLGAMLGDLAGRNAGRVVEVALVGNTVMHHLFCGIDVAPLSHAPFASSCLGEQRFSAGALHWALPNETIVRFLPCLGGFVGSDILAGIVAVDLGRDQGLRALVDLGTNGEIAVGNRDRILVASTAAGTAFEAGAIRQGMRAATGAISRVDVEGSELRCTVLGGGDPIGICGSGVIDAVAVGLETGAINAKGRIVTGSRRFPLANGIELVQADIRELQLAKGAIAAGLHILLRQWGASADDLRTLYLSGAFGNDVRPRSAIRIGLLEVPPDRVVVSGNTALHGTKMLLCADEAPRLAAIDHVMLAADGRFEEAFVAKMSFPARRGED